MPAVGHELIGRDAELATVAKFLEPAQDSKGALLLEGEAGIGKTSLWKAALTTATSFRYRILSSGPTEAEAHLPYAVLGDLLDPASEESMASLSDPLFSDDFARARILLKRVLVLTEGRDESLRAPVLFHLAEIECWTGDWLLAAVYVHECENSVIHSGHLSYARLPLNAKALLNCYRGEFDAARAAAEEALAISTSIGDEPYCRRALATLGSTELAAGDVAAANRYFDRLRARGEHRPFAGVVRYEGDEVEALLAINRLADAEAIAARIAGWNDPWPRALGARIRGLLAAARGDVEASMREFDEALSAHESLTMPLERARTLLAHGTMLRRSKQKRAARERLEEALEMFNSLGARAWIRRTESELSRIAPPPAGVSSLTPTEARVAELVASGRTNKEVAAELFLSAKTVEANLSRVYAKLTVRSRTELAARLMTQRHDDAVRSKPGAPSLFQHLAERRLREPRVALPIG